MDILFYFINTLGYISGKVFYLPPATYKFIYLFWYVNVAAPIWRHRSRHQRCAAAGRSTLAASGIGDGRSFSKGAAGMLLFLSRDLGTEDFQQGRRGWPTGAR